MINDFLSGASLFGLVITFMVYWLFQWLSDRLKMPLLNPMLFTIAALIALLKLFNISYETYNLSAGIMDYLISPATVCMAVPLYRQLSLLKENAAALVLGTLSGVISSLLVVTGICLLLKVDPVVYHSILPKSVTTAIAREISFELGGNVGLCIICVCIAGSTGAAIVRYVPKWFGITDDLALGVAIGTNSHVMGTSATLEFNQVAGAMSSLALVIAGIMTVILAPIISGLVT